MRKTKILPSLLLVMLLCSCTANKNVSLEDYQNELEYTDSFTICTLNDIHLSILSDTDLEFEYLTNVIYSHALLDGVDVNTASEEVLSEYAPSMLMINGDAFQTADKSLVKRFFNYIDSLYIPFAFTYGNHDLHGLYGETYIDSIIKKCQNSLLLNPKDDVFGNANYVINLKKNEDTMWQVYVLDSNTYKGLMDYDIIHDDQIEWYKNQVVEATTNNGGTPVPSLMFFHIPVEEFYEAWSLETDGQNTHHPDSSFDGYNASSTFWMGEGVSYGYGENDLFETAQELGSTKAFICAHDHINVTDFAYNKDNNGTIRLIYGVKTGHGIYHDERIMGCAFYTLNEDGSFTNERVNVSYDYEAFIMSDDYINGLIEEGN